jgi:ketosteroid isomerase-like protein
MSERNVEVVRRGFEALNGGVEAFIEFVDPEFETETSPELTPEPDVYRGYDGVRRFWTQFLSAWDDYGVEVEELIDAGDQVVAVMRLSGRTNELEVDEARSSLLTLRDRRIVRIEPFASKDAALEAVGTRE